jgi:DNA-binding NtrC family response regulator
MADTLTIPGMLPAGSLRPVSYALELVGRAPATLRVQELVRRAGPLASPVLLVAERGVDADGVARELHRGRGPDAPFVSVACGGLDPTRLDRLLFGGRDGALPTDLEPIAADSRLAQARGGTLLLQDVTELPASAQARLARVLRDGEVRIDGVPVATGIRFVATATTSIDGDVHEHRFRADLYRRLGASRIDLPPLRQRQDDVPALARRLLDGVCAAEQLPTRTFTQAALALLGAVSWPGNLAELREVVERVALSTADDPLQVEHVLPAMQLDRPRATFVPEGNLRDARLRFERDYIAAVLQHHGWRMSDAAQTLGIQRPNLYRKARQLGIPLTKATE